MIDDSCSFVPRILKEEVFVFVDNSNFFIGAQCVPGPAGSVIQDFTTRVRPDRVHEVVVDGRKVGNVYKLLIVSTALYQGFSKDLLVEVLESIIPWERIR
jgi:hypothetical protein